MNYLITPSIFSMIECFICLIYCAFNCGFIAFNIYYAKTCRNINYFIIKMNRTTGECVSSFSGNALAVGSSLRAINKVNSSPPIRPNKSSGFMQSCIIFAASTNTTSPPASPNSSFIFLNLSISQ